MAGKIKLLFLYLKKKKKENFPEVIKNVPHFTEIQSVLYS
jgi:hypothetical protein